MSDGSTIAALSEMRDFANAQAALSHAGIDT
jgi:hypothetical protein